jgi:prevent-host-death family protein
MPIVNIYEAKTNLSKLVDQASSGEDVIIGRSGKPLARLTRYAPDKRTVRFGVLKGKLQVADDFDAALPGPLQAAFERG